MWRKFNRSKDPNIGSPILIETTFDRQYLDTIPEVDSLRSGRNSGTVPGLPELPFKAVEPLPLPSGPLKDHRASSVYSQADAETLHVDSRGSDRRASVCSEVSPLTSPRVSTDLDSAKSCDVSPIEQRPPDLPKQDPKPRSQLPIFRKAPSVADSASPDSPSSPSWRSASAEVLQNKNSQPPVDVSKEERLAMLKEKNKKLLSGFQERPRNNNKETTRPRREDSLDHPVYREPWKGASGRTTLVEPFRNVPRSKMDTGPVPKKRSAGKDLSAHTAVTVSVAGSPSAESPSPAASPQQFEPAVLVDEPIQPVAPLKFGNKTTRLQSPVTAENLTGPFDPRYSAATVSSSEHVPGDIVNGSRDDSNSIPPAETVKPFPDSSDHPRPPTADEDLPSRFSWTTSGTTISPPRTPENNPSSRFSWTTHATSVRDSPQAMAERDTNTPPVPPVPYMANTIAIRKGPILSHAVHPNTLSTQKVNRKPTPSNISTNRSSSLYSTTTAVGADKSPTTTATSPADRSKSLPQCPPELEAKDRIAALEARVDVIVRRRGNINQILKELNNVVQPTSFAYDLATKEEVKKTVKSLEEELSDLRVEEHEIGMKLHRLLKKRDQESLHDGYATGLWIKRVTS